MGGADETTTFGVSLDRGDLERDDLLELLENGHEVNAYVDRVGPGKFKIELVQPPEQPGEQQEIAPGAD